LTSKYNYDLIPYEDSGKTWTLPCTSSKSWRQETM